MVLERILKEGMWRFGERKSQGMNSEGEKKGLLVEKIKRMPDRRLRILL